jgi:hypothetical protein
VTDSTAERQAKPKDKPKAKPKKKRKIRWRKWFRALHRDIGYGVAALTIAYCISGIAVNHIEDWNPNYTFEQVAINVGPLPGDDYQGMQDKIVKTLSIDSRRVKGHFMETTTLFRVFMTNSEEIMVDVRDGKGEFKKVTTRPVLYELNALHLNNIKGAWTWIADLFSLLLIFLALTGIFMMKGKHGLGGRGKYYLALGFVVPGIFLWYIVTGA